MILIVNVSTYLQFKQLNIIPRKGNGLLRLNEVYISDIQHTTASIFKLIKACATAASLFDGKIFFYLTFHRKLQTKNLLRIEPETTLQTQQLHTLPKIATKN